METVAWGPRVGESVKTSRCRASKRNGMCTAGTATVQHGGQAGKTGRRASRRAGEPNGRPSRLSTLLQLGPTFAGDSVTPSEEPNSGGGQQATGRGAAHHPPPRPDKVAPPVIPRVQGPHSPQRHEVMAVACLCVPISSAPSSQADVLPYKDT
ncbi:hypothetical protein PCL_06048 [Purpureocillium lilacinum]|uniref:Uncharacterized protein n=1 Tax=Purpureocillium lilacinum TaxID=33203 RepID=A0A2U3ELS0_PURLI|nr:hypothetical protein Purlil1_5756 [Purpureocillium lilacinum]PWI75390.1 hypothetical protein PCL_06048 [Purpureocillium lilacinum]